MNGTKQLWSPLSLQAEASVRVTAENALACLEAFLGGGNGGLADQNTAAQLIRLQVGLKEEVIKRDVKAEDAVKEEGESVSPVKEAGKKRKRDKKNKGMEETTIKDEGDQTAVNESVLESPDKTVEMGTEEPKKKKKKHSKKAKEAAE